MSNFRVYIQLPPYLEQWVRHAYWSEQRQRVEFPRKSAERIIMELYLTTPPKDLRPSFVGVPVEVPTMYGKNPASHCHLPVKATAALVSTIKKRFRKLMWDRLHRVFPKGVQLTDQIYEFLTEQGIEQSEKNFLAVRQAYMRMRKVYENPKK